MSFVKILVYGSILMILATGTGWIAARVSGRPDLGMTFGIWLIRSLYVAGAALVAGLVVGGYHLYLYVFTERKPLGFFATTNKDAKP